MKNWVKMWLMAGFVILLFLIVCGLMIIGMITPQPIVP